MVVAFIIVFAAAFALGVVCEHYLGPRKRLTQDQLFQALDLIDAECDRNTPDHVKELRDELYRYLDSNGACTISTELWKILERVEEMPEGFDGD